MWKIKSYFYAKLCCFFNLILGDQMKVSFALITLNFKHKLNRVFCIFFCKAVINYVFHFYILVLLVFSLDCRGVQFLFNFFYGSLCFFFLKEFNISSFYLVTFYSIWCAKMLIYFISINTHKYHTSIKNKPQYFFGSFFFIYFLNYIYKFRKHRQNEFNSF